MFSGMLAGSKKISKKDKFKKTKGKTQETLPERSENFVDQLSELELESNNLSSTLESAPLTKGILDF
jgi:hypothetical protein